MSAEAKVPVFGHVQDQATYEANVAAGRTLCEECSGGGNHLMWMYRACPKCGGLGHTDPIAPAECLDCGRPAGHQYSCTFSQHGDPIHDAIVPARWPEWASNEDGDVWTLRATGWTPEQALAEVEPWLMVDDGYVLFHVAEVPMVFLPDADGPGDWRIQQAHEDEHDQVAVYVQWELAEAASGGESA